MLAESMHMHLQGNDINDRFKILNLNMKNGKIFCNWLNNITVYCRFL